MFLAISGVFLSTTLGTTAVHHLFSVYICMRGLACDATRYFVKPLRCAVGGRGGQCRSRLSSVLIIFGTQVGMDSVSVVASVGQSHQRKHSEASRRGRGDNFFKHVSEVSLLCRS